MLRRLSSLIVATAVAVGALAAAAPAAHASTEESQFTSLANQERAKRGLRSYTVASDLVAVARRHAQRMASKGSIWHNPNLGSEVTNWQAVGENVGMGGSASSTVLGLFCGVGRPVAAAAELAVTRSGT